MCLRLTTSWNFLPLALNLLERRRAKVTPTVTGGVSQKCRSGLISSRVAEQAEGLAHVQGGPQNPEIQPLAGTRMRKVTRVHGAGSKRGIWRGAPSRAPKTVPAAPRRSWWTLPRGTLVSVLGQQPGKVTRLLHHLASS